MADVSGLVRLPGDVPAPMTATSRGVGELVAAAVAAGCRRVVLGIGGSASTDGGAGMLAGLGARLLDADGEPVADGGAALARVASVDLTAVRERMAGVEVVVACDVDNPLTGPTGAAAVYGPQKGADPDQVRELDDALAHFADACAAATGRDLRDHAGCRCGRRRRLRRTGRARRRAPSRHRPGPRPGRLPPEAGRRRPGRHRRGRARRADPARQGARRRGRRRPRRRPPRGRRVRPQHPDRRPVGGVRHRRRVRPHRPRARRTPLPRRPRPAAGAARRTDRRRPPPGGDRPLDSGDP